MKKSIKYEYFGSRQTGKPRLSWSGVFAGLVSFIAIFLVLSLITFAIGLTTFNPLSDNPLKHVGTGMTIWTVITLILSFGISGFISGLVSNKAGFLHGMMTWAAVVILMAFITTSTLSSALNIVGNTAAGIAKPVASGTEAIVNKSGDKIGDLIGVASDKMEEVDTDKLDSNVKEFLKDTDIEQLQPEYLNNQLKEVQSEVKEAGKNIIVDPANYKAELDKLTKSLEARSENIKNSLDKEKIAKAIGENTELTEAEANEAVDNIINEYNIAAEKATESINQLSADIEKTTEDIREGAEEVTDTAGKSSLYLFFGLLIGLIISGFAGVMGARYLDDDIDEIEEVEIIK